MGPPLYLPLISRILYLIPRIFSQQQVIIPRIDEISIQKTAPGPPAQIAVATPMMLPVPRHAASAEVSAENWDIVPSLVLFFLFLNAEMTVEPSHSFVPKI